MSLMRPRWVIPLSLALAAPLLLVGLRSARRPAPLPTVGVAPATSGERPASVPPPRFIPPPQPSEADVVAGVADRPDSPADQVLEAFRIEACACRDKACFQEVGAKYGPRLAGSGSKADKADPAVASRVAAAVADCVADLPAHPSG